MASLAYQRHFYHSKFHRYLKIYAKEQRSDKFFTYRGSRRLLREVVFGLSLRSGKEHTLVKTPRDEKEGYLGDCKDNEARERAIKMDSVHI